MINLNHNPDDPTGPRKSRFWALRNSQIRSQPWRWPLGTLGDRDPIVLSEHLDGERRGVDLGYEVRPYDAALYVPVYAVQAGKVMFCGEARTGFAISLRHYGTDWVSYYGHLSRVFLAADENRRAVEWVRGGDVIGYAAKAPIHVRFELVRWTDQKRFATVDPVPEMAAWIKPRVDGPAASTITRAA